MAGGVGGSGGVTGGLTGGRTVLTGASSALPALGTGLSGASLPHTGLDAGVWTVVGAVLLLLGAAGVAAARKHEVHFAPVAAA